jgi:hypothetical protein
MTSIYILLVSFLALLPLKDDPILRGAPLGDSPVVALARVVKNPRAYEGRSIILEGTVRNVCQNKGCWMELGTGRRGKGLRVTFKDYGFFVPTDSKGWHVRAEGTVQITTLSKEEVDHLTGEGATMKRNRDGTATEIGFIATGVEVRL